MKLLGPPGSREPEVKMNKNQSHEGRTVYVRATAKGNYLTATFPGWGDPNYADHLKPLADIAGMGGIVQHVESHGSNPWTRYTVIFGNAGMAMGLIPGEDFDWA